MKEKAIRVLLILLTSFIALTAIGGGVAILTEIDKFPVEWLKGTLFTNYTIPALILAVIVGGSSLWASICLIRKQKKAMKIAMLAGGIMIGYISIEVLILKQEPMGPTSIEMLYFIVGLLIVVLTVFSKRI